MAGLLGWLFLLNVWSYIAANVLWTSLIWSLCLLLNFWWWCYTEDYVFTLILKFLLTLMLTFLFPSWYPSFTSLSMTFVYLFLTSYLKSCYLTPNPWTITLKTLTNSSLLIKLELKQNFLIDLSIVNFWFIYNLTSISLNI